MANLQERVDYHMELFEQIRYKLRGNDAVAATILQEAARDWRLLEIREERMQGGAEPATARQREFLESLEVEFSPEITKREASRLLDAAKLQRQRQ